MIHLRSWFARHRFGAALTLLGIVPVLSLALEAFSAAAMPSLWIAETRGLLKIAQADGAIEAQIPLGPDTQAVAVDGQHERVWAAAGRQLLSLDFDGNALSTTAVDVPAGNPVLLQVDPRADRVWLAMQSQLHLFDGAGTLLRQARLAHPVTGIAVDRARSRLWLASKGAVHSYDAAGNHLGEIDTAGARIVRALDYDASLDQFWVVADDSLRRYSPEGVLQSSVQSAWWPQASLIAADQDGGLWASDSRQLVRIGRDGSVAFGLEPAVGSFVVSLAVDTRDHSVWVAGQRHVAHYGADGSVLGVFALEQGGGAARLIRQIALPSGPAAPQLEIVAPADGSHVNSSRPQFELSYRGNDVDPASIAFMADAAPLPVACTARPDAASCSPVSPLMDGTHDITVTIADRSGLVSEPALARIHVDTAAPVVTVAEPRDGLLTSQPGVRFAGSTSESCALTLNGTAVALVDLRFSAGPLPLVEGSNAFELRAVDAAGNVGVRQLAVTLDTVPPAAPVAGRIEADAAAGQVTVTGAPGSVEPGTTVTVVNLRTGERATVSANADGSFAATLAGESGDALQIFATDGATNQGAVTQVEAVGGPFSGPIELSGITPANGATVNGDFVLVSLDLKAPPNTGVTINDFVAAATPGAVGARYHAHVPLQLGQNTLSIAAHGQDGRVVTRSLTVTSTGPYPYRIVANRSAGVAPLDVELEILDIGGRGILQVQIDFNNDGVVDHVGDGRSPIATTYGGIGLRQARVVVFDNTGRGHVQMHPTILLSPALIDADIQAVWAGMNEALVAGEKEAALQFLSGGAREQYGPIFDTLLPRMPEIVASYSPLRRSVASGSYSEYGVNRMIDGINRVFLIGFVTSESGQWLADSM